MTWIYQLQSIEYIKNDMTEGDHYVIEHGVSP